MRAFDDGFDELAQGAEFAVSGGSRTISVRLDDGFSAAQVFSPRGAAFVCFEPMTAPTNALRSGAGLLHVAPGDEFAATFTITVATG